MEVTRFEESDPAFVFFSGWSEFSLSSRSGGTIHRTGTVGETLDVSFTGPMVRWIGALGPVYGEAQV